MEISVRKSDVFRTRGAIECLIVPVLEGRPPAGLDGAPAGLKTELAELIERQELSPELSRTLVYYPRSTPKVKRLVMVGFGKAESLDLDTLRNAFARVVKQVEPLPVRTVSLVVSEELRVGGDYSATIGACVEGALLADYRFDAFKSKKKKSRGVVLEELRFFPGDAKATCDNAVVRFSELSAEAALIARDLGNTPSNHLQPLALAERAKQLMGEAGGKFSMFDRKKIESLGMNSLMCVARGSAAPPCLIFMEYKPKTRKRLPKVALVGKGVTFDTGGISIKPSAGMEDMKFDMCGAAAVVGTMWGAAKLGLPVHLIGVVPAVENMPGADATRPGDVVTALNGKTIEVINTDAEGRLILADALTYTEREYKPDIIIDLATLTGSCIVALGHVAAALMSEDEALSKALRDAAETSGEPLWPLPMYPAYRDLLKSQYADVKNIGGKWGGAITAGFFLSHFVDKTPWAHLDIASVAWNQEGKAYAGKGATGYGVRLLLTWLAALRR